MERSPTARYVEEKRGEGNNTRWCAVCGVRCAVCCVWYMRCAVWYCMLIQMLLSPSSSPPSFVGQTYIKTQWRDRISTLPTFTQKLLAKLEAEKVIAVFI